MWRCRDIALSAKIDKPDGVYAGIAEHGGTTYPAAVHCGPNSTFGETARTFEVHLVGFNGDLYDQPLAVDLLAHIRKTTRFSDPDELKAQLHRDIADVRQIAQEFGSQNANGREWARMGANKKE